MYDQFSHDYDRFVNWNNRLAYEMPFLLQKISCRPAQPGAPMVVLDAACGTGQHAIALAKSGMQVTGADLSAEMIDVAHENARAAGVSVDFKAAGFGALAAAFGEKSFDALLCLGNSLPHLLTQSDLLAAMKDFYTCLAPGGLLILQNRNFDSVLASRERWMEPQAFSDGKHEWIYQRFYDFEPDGLIRFNIVTLNRQIPGDWQTSLTSTHLYPQTRKEVEDAATEAGFTRAQVFGSLADVEFDPIKSGNLVLLAYKP